MSQAITNAGGVRRPTSALLLRVADVAMQILCDDPAIALTVADTVRPFVIAATDPDVTIRVERAGHLRAPSGEKLFDSSGVWRMYRDRGGYVFSFVSTALGSAPYRLARFNPSFTSGTVWLNGAAFPDGTALEPLEYPLAELLMINVLARGRGVEIHGCAVIDRDGCAYLFAGPSGAGKSTSARLWALEGATVLSDDRVILRLRDNRVWVYGTPWHGDQQFASPASAPLARIFFLVHGGGNAARPLAGAAAVARLFTCCFPPFHDRAGLDFTLELLEGIVDRLPCFELAFVPDPGVVSFVRGHA